MDIVKDINFLSKKSEPVASVEEATGIINVLRKEIDKRDNCVGLAACQIGILKQVGVIRNPKKDSENDYVILINPKEIEKEDSFVFFSEGCMSIPEKRFQTTRYQNYVIENNVIDGKEFRKEQQYFYYETGEKEDLVAIAVQHEIDHMNGITIMDRSVEIKPYQKEKEKVGRNDPCPCGSGKKYKKCCIDKN